MTRAGSVGYGAGFVTGLARVAVFAALASCGGRPGSELFTLVPSDAVAVAYAPALGRLCAHAVGVARSLGLSTGDGPLARPIAILASGADLDLRDPGALATLGIDAAGPALVSVRNGGGVVVAIPLTDAGRFDRYLRAEVGRGPAAVFGHAPAESGLDVRVVRDGPGGPVRLAWVDQGSRAIVAAGPSATDLAAVVARLAGGGEVLPGDFDPESLFGNANPRSDLLIAVRPPTRSHPRAPLDPLSRLEGISLISLQISPQRVTLEYDDRLPPADAALASSLFGAEPGRSAEGPRLGGSAGDRIGGDAIVALRLTAGVKPLRSLVASDGSPDEELAGLLPSLTGRMAIAAYPPSTAALTAFVRRWIAGSSTDQATAALAAIPIVMIADLRPEHGARSNATAWAGYLARGLDLEEHARLVGGAPAHVLTTSDDAHVPVLVVAPDVRHDELVIGTVAGVDHTLGVGPKGAVTLPAETKARLAAPSGVAAYVDLVAANRLLGGLAILVPSVPPWESRLLASLGALRLEADTGPDGIRAKVEVDLAGR